MSSRYETPFAITLTAAQTSHLATHNWPSSDRDQLMFFTDGLRVIARWPAQVFEHPPTFTGRVETRPAGAVVSGTVQESRGNRFVWESVWLAVRALLLLILVVGVLVLVFDDLTDALPPLLIGAIGSVLMIPYLRWQVGKRRPVYDEDTARLTRGITGYLLTGDAERPVV